VRTVVVERPHNSYTKKPAKNQRGEEPQRSQQRKNRVPALVDLDHKVEMQNDFRSVQAPPTLNRQAQRKRAEVQLTQVKIRICGADAVMERRKMRI